MIGGADFVPVVDVRIPFHWSEHLPIGPERGILIV